MPNVVGMTIEDARAELTPYNVRITTENKIDPAAAGQVIDQSPLGGADFDTDVTLTVSVAPPAVPDVFGQSIGDALEVLENLGFEVAQNEILTEEVPNGEILAQDPPAGTENAGTVSLDVAKRPVVVQLIDLQPVSTSRVNSGSYDSNGQAFDKSLLFYRNNSAIEYNLSRSYRRFVTTIGVEDTADIDVVVRLNILGDGAILETRDYGFGETVDVNLDVTGLLRLGIDISILDGDGDLVLGNPRLYGVEGEIPN